MIKVCIADDEEYVLKSIEQRIEKTEYELLVAGTAKNGVEAYELYDKVKPDIYFVDINMPLCNGLDFIERVRKSDPQSITKFIIISGYDDFAYMKKAIRTGVTNYIMKPIQHNEFIETLQQACESLKVIKERKRSELNESFIFFEDYISLNPAFSGTALLFYGEHILDKLQNELLVLTQKEKNIFRKNWDRIKFHGIPDLVLMLGNEIWLNEQDICSIWNQMQKFGELYLVYKQERAMPLSMAAEEIEDTLNNRFWQGAMHILKSSPLKKEEADVDLSKLELMMESSNKERCQETVLEIFNKVFTDIRYRSRLKHVYNSILFLIANKYAQNNLEIPEKLKIELYPFSLAKCKDRKEVEEKVIQHTLLLQNKLIQSTKKKDLVDKVIQYLETHFADEITLTEIAGEFFIVPNYLAKRFKEKKNCTVMQYLEDIRMKKAKEYLDLSDLNIMEIANKVGYTDANYFTRAFRKTYGMSPRSYRGAIKE